jgi:hypothetical protein
MDRLGRDVVEQEHHRRPYGDPTATERVFVNAEGVKRAYKRRMH